VSFSAVVTDSVPQWFEDAVKDAPIVAEAVVDGARVSYRMWGESRSGAPDLLLVHGGAAHARWWDHLAPLLATDRRVVAIDMSGHGDSDHRASYSMDGWADELVAVISAAGLADHPVIAGHSLGGMVAAVVAGRSDSTLSGTIVVDSPVEPDGTGARGEADSPSFGMARVYSTREAAVARFRPVPRQSMLPYVAAHIADCSVREVAGGWTWKFDPTFMTMSGEMPRTLEGLRSRVVLIAGERGILSAAARQAADEAAEVAVVEIPGAGHAIMLDQPMALLAALRGILAGWES